MHISVLTPTFNDAKSIEETLKSLISQTYTDWEWIVINDGSTDETDETIRKLIDKYDISEKCKYIKQQNADQLNAIIHGTRYITGEYVFVLHSDDLLPQDDFFEKCVDVMNENPEIDGIFGDLIIIDKDSNITGLQKVKKYNVNPNIPPLMLLWLGRNLYSDVAFHRTGVYQKQVFENYLTWNIPLWLDLSNRRVEMLNYKSVEFPMLKYRVHGENYANNKLGQMNVINGELRTATELMQYYDIPHYQIQYFLFRLMNKILPQREYKIRYSEKETKNKYALVSFIIQQRYPQGVEDNIFLSSVLGFYKNVSERVLKIEQLPQNLKIYYGKDVRAFNKRILENSLETFYVNLLQEMEKGFKAVEVSECEDIAKMKSILKFLCIGHVEVRRKE